MDQPLAGFEKHRGKQFQKSPRTRQIKVLPRSLRTTLVDLLLHIHPIAEDRTILLDNLPNANALTRKGDNPLRDVQLIVDQYMSAGRLPDGEWPLLILIENALPYVPGGPDTDLGMRLQEVRQELMQLYQYSSELPALSPSLSRAAAPEAIRPPGMLLNNSDVQLKLLQSRYYREDFYLSAADAKRWGIQQRSQFAILAVHSLAPDKPVQRYGVQLTIDNTLAHNTIAVNQHFASDRGLDVVNCIWEIYSAKRIIPINKAILELAVERRKIEEELGKLSEQRQGIFEQRCLLVEEGRTIQQLSLRVLDRAYFELYDLEAGAKAFEPDTLLSFTEQTEIQLFVPYRKSAVDMLMLIDGSGSMDTTDYRGKDGKKHTRLFGVQEALKILIQRRQVTGNRISRFAIMAFGEKTAMLYPSTRHMTELTSFTQVQSIISDMQKNLNKQFLEQLQVNRYRATDISRALKDAGELLDLYHQEKNEKVIVLLSDGAHWTECIDDSRSGEIESTLADPAALAENLHSRSNIRIHTIGITTEQEYKVWEADILSRVQAGARVSNTAPDTALLRKIAEAAEGTFFPSAGTQELDSIFDEIGEGMRYPLARSGKHVTE